MARYELLLRGGHVVTPEGLQRADVAVEGGRIAAVAPEILEDAAEVIDAAGSWLLPGAIDVHVHFNEPGRTSWEGLQSGSSALAAGGGTVFCDMPLNSHPPLLDADAFYAKRDAALAGSVTDFALWGGLTPQNLAQLPELAELGVIGFKAFMSDSGIAEFAAADDLTLLRGMELAADLGLPVAVHAESESLTRALTRQLRASGGRQVRDYLASRPLVAEREAVARALLFAEETGVALHLVHISSAAAVELIAAARARGVRVSCETCPHYLHFSSDDLEERGGPLKCAPPLRSPAEREALWAAVQAGKVDLIASDHSPAPPERKAHDDFFEVWGGIAGVQSTVPLLLTACADGRLQPAQLARLVTAAPAERFALPGKGRIAVGFDADITVVAPDETYTLQREALFDRHRASPYVGERFRGRVRRTLLRGRTIFLDGRVVASGGGQFLRPERRG